MYAYDDGLSGYYYSLGILFSTNGEQRKSAEYCKM